MIRTYFKKVEELHRQVLDCEAHNLHLAAEKVSDAIKNGGIVQLFGSGPSHILKKLRTYGAVYVLKSSLYEYKGGWGEVFDQTKGGCFNFRFQYNKVRFQFQYFCSIIHKKFNNAFWSMDGKSKDGVPKAKTSG